MSRFAEGALDELVHEVASEIASNVNNSGEDDQIEYLLSNGWTIEDIEERLVS